MRYYFFDNISLYYARAAHFFFLFYGGAPHPPLPTRPPSTLARTYCVPSVFPLARSFCSTRYAVFFDSNFFFLLFFFYMTHAYDCNNNIIMSAESSASKAIVGGGGESLSRTHTSPTGPTDLVLPRKIRTHFTTIIIVIKNTAYDTGRLKKNTTRFWKLSIFYYRNVKE